MALLVSALLPVSALGQDRAPNFIEKLIAAEKPCKSLKTDMLGIEMAVDTLERIVLDEVDISLRGTVATIGAKGEIACKTSESSFVSGNASARIDASSTMDLETCTMPEIAIELADFGGSFGDVLKTFQPVLRPVLEKSARDSFIKECQKLKAANPPPE